MKFAFATTALAAAASSLATANGHRHTIRGSQEEETMSMLLAESHKGSGSGSRFPKSTTSSRSQGGKVPNCKLEEFAGFWQGIDVDDASNLRASIKCFKDGETQVKQTIIFCSYHIYSARIISIIS